MARKKTKPDTAPPEGAPAATAELDNSNGTTAPRRPLVSWALNSDRTTRLEVACWVNTVRATDGEEFEQVSFTLQRSYRNDDGWQRGGSWRAHDLPVLLFLLQKAHAFALDRRTTATDDCPI